MAFRSREVMAHAVTTSRLLKNPAFALILRLLWSDFGTTAIYLLSPHAGVAAPKYPEKGRRSPAIGNVDMALVLESP